MSDSPRMDIFFSQVFSLLTSETGSLAYHLILAFSILGALQITFSHIRGELTPISKRLGIGLGSLLILQLFLFLISGLGWQGLVNSDKLLPPLDRSVLLISTVLIIWMLVSTQPTRIADFLMLGLVLVIFIGSIFGCLWWINQPSELNFNYSSLDLIAQISQMILLLGGATVLVLLRPAGWVSGLWMLGLMLLGPVLFFLFPQEPGDYSGAVRLSLIAAYPFLLFLPQHVPLHLDRETVETAAEYAGAIIPGDQKSGPDTEFLHLTTQLTIENDPDQSARLAVSSMADYARSDICLLAKVVDEEGVAVVTAGFDRVNGRFLDKIAIPVEKIPVFASSYRLGRMRKLKVKESSPEMVHLIRAIDLQETGNVLIIPVLSQDGKPLSGFIFLNPYSEVDWSEDQQSRIFQYAKVLVYLLQRIEERLAYAEEMGQSQTMLRLLQEQVKMNGLERQKLNDQILVLQQESGKDFPFSIDSANIPSPDSTREVVPIEKQDVSAESKGHTKTEADLRLALEEIVRLRTDLAELETRVSDGSMDSDRKHAGIVTSASIATIAEDIRDTVSSIVENNRILLDETTGNIDSSQRKYLERINNATTRLGHLAGELVLYSSLKGEGPKQKLEDVDLLTLLGNLIKTKNPIAETRNVRLEQEFPVENIHLQSSASILDEVFSDLLEHAILSAENGGHVCLSVKTQHAEGKQDYILAQVSNSGEGIDSQVLSQLFSPQVGRDSIHAVELGNVDFPLMKVKLESISGKIWVDSEHGKGSIFSLLFPTMVDLPFELFEKGSNL